MVTNSQQLCCFHDSCIKECLIKFPVVCSAGVGRTGTYIALNNLLDQAKEENMVDILSLIHTLRTKRPNMIQSLVSMIGSVITLELHFISGNKLQVSFQHIYSCIDVLLSLSLSLSLSIPFYPNNPSPFYFL